MKELICHGIRITVVAWLATLPAGAQSPHEISPAASQSTPIPMDQLGDVANKQYQGDGLSVTATPNGARLRCAFQRLEGQVTQEGLWLSSTAGDAKGEHFRVMAVEVGRSANFGEICRSGAVPGHSNVNISDVYETFTSPFLSMLLRPGTGALL